MTLKHAPTDKKSSFVTPDRGRGLENATDFSSLLGDETHDKLLNEKFEEMIASVQVLKNELALASEPSPVNSGNRL